jgi:hypothetical protein
MQLSRSAFAVLWVLAAAAIPAAPGCLGTFPPDAVLDGGGTSDAATANPDASTDAGSATADGSALDAASDHRADALVDAPSASDASPDSTVDGSKADGASDGSPDTSMVDGSEADGGSDAGPDTSMVDASKADGGDAGNLDGGAEADSSFDAMASQCEITCQPGEDEICGDAITCNLFCYSSAFAPDPGCPAIGCGDLMCTGVVIVNYGP